MSDVGALCPAIKGFCEEALLCRNCAMQVCCLKRKTNEGRPKRNRNCFLCKYMKAVTMGVECTKKYR